MAEFKISRLRFSWVGEWQDQKVFNKDEIHWPCQRLGPWIISEPCLIQVA